MTAFYRNLGFNVFYRGVETWNDTVLEIVKLKAKDDSGVIELIKGDWPNHVAVTVENIKEIEGEETERPNVFVKWWPDPEGNPIEYVEVKNVKDNS